MRWYGPAGMAICALVATGGSVWHWENDGWWGDARGAAAHVAVSLLLVAIGLGVSRPYALLVAFAQPFFVVGWQGAVVVVRGHDAPTVYRMWDDADPDCYVERATGLLSCPSGRIVPSCLPLDYTLAHQLAMTAAARGSYALWGPPPGRYTARIPPDAEIPALVARRTRFVVTEAGVEPAEEAARFAPDVWKYMHMEEDLMARLDGKRHVRPVVVELVYLEPDLHLRVEGDSVTLYQDSSALYTWRLVDGRAVGHE